MGSFAKGSLPTYTEKPSDTVPKEKEQIDTKYPEILGDATSLTDISAALMNLNVVENAVGPRLGCPNEPRLQ
jgi:hypothetical protein